MMRGLAAAAMAAFLAVEAGAGFNYWDPADPSKTPKLLSHTGLYLDLSKGHEMAPEAVFYTVNSPVWNDGAEKRRWVLLKPGTAIAYRETDDYWTYPDSAVFVQEFAFDTVAGDSGSRLLWETRLLILKKEPSFQAGGGLEDKWYGFSYRWRRDRSDADLTPEAGVGSFLKWYPEGLGKPAAQKKWVFPAAHTCFHCHRTDWDGTTHGRSVLGFFGAQLNMPSPSRPGVNQLQDLFDRKILKGAHPVDWNRSPRWYGIASTDPAATLEKKSRAYIAANCSGCHGARGLATGATFGVDLNYDYHTGLPAMKLEYRSVSWSFGLDTVAPMAMTPEEERRFGVYLITPGYPQKSVLPFRMSQRNPAPPGDPSAFDPDRNQMPPLGSFVPDQAAIQVVTEWIRSSPTPVPIILHGAALPTGGPYFSGRVLRIPAGLLADAPAPVLLRLDGREVPLRRQAPGEYALPASATRGVYVLRLGTRKYTRTFW